MTYIYIYNYIYFLFHFQAGDRFYYENGGMPTSFTEAQLQEIRKTSLARVLCDTSDEMDVMQPLAFLHANFTWVHRAL